MALVLLACAAVLVLTTVEKLVLLLLFSLPFCALSFTWDDSLWNFVPGYGLVHARPSEPCNTCPGHV